MAAAIARHCFKDYDFRNPSETSSEGPVTARDEDLGRRNPEEYKRRKREAYIRGGGNPSPAVVTFTTATASMSFLVVRLLRCL